MLDVQYRIASSKWRSSYPSILEDSTVAVKRDGPRRYLEFYNTPQMKWFLETPNVNSYEEQIRVRTEYLKGKIDYEIDLPCRIDRPVGGPNGTTPKCVDSFESWYEQPPAEWTKCQPDGPIVRHAANPPGGVLVRIRHPVAEIHLAEDGRVDSFDLRKMSPQRVYTAKQNTRCYSEPTYDLDETVKSIPFRKGQEAPALGMNIGCTKNASDRGYGFEAVSVDGQTCWLQTQLVKTVRKRK